MESKEIGLLWKKETDLFSLQMKHGVHTHCLLVRMYSLIVEKVWKRMTTCVVVMMMKDVI
jgi:hypothetical protein